MNARDAAARRAPIRVAGVSLVVAAIALMPSLAAAADSAGSTIRAAIDSRGKVSSAPLLNADGTSSGFTGNLPLMVDIKHTTSGATQTFSYHVVNTVSKTQTIRYDD